MQNFTRSHIALTLVLSSMSGCAISNNRLTQKPSATQPVRIVTTQRHPPEVRYGTILSPQRLTASQLAEITSTAQAKCPAGREIWMILVRSNREFEGKLQYEATVYFTPDTQASRIRTGRLITIDSLFDPMRAKVRGKLGEPEDTSLPRYAQVSRALKPFGDKLTTPDGEMRPFYFPENLSADDLVALIDAAWEEHDSEKIFAREGEPVCRIESPRNADGEFEVFFGAQDGGLAGSGSMVVVRRSGAKFKAEKGVATWVS